VEFFFILQNLLQFFFRKAADKNQQPKTKILTAIFF